MAKWHTTDTAICKYADEHNLVVVTKDGDFKNSHFINRTPKKVIRITLGNVSNEYLIRLFTRHLSLITHLANKDEFYIEVGEEQIAIFN
ncbi:MAG: DUF5615 family PIN-like protein [Sphingobacteriales bacterium]